MEVTAMAKKKAAWTVMVYLAGDNNLTTECMFALTEMKKAAVGKDLNVIVQFDPDDPYLPTHRYEINKSSRNEKLNFDIIDRATYNAEKGEVTFNNESLNASSLADERREGRDRAASLDEASLSGELDADEVITDDTDTGSPVTLYNFISFCLEKYPAKHYMVVLSGHAGGTERDYLLKDESPTGSLTFKELKQVFKRVAQDRNGELIDIVGMDNCLMSMAEICYELRDLAEVVVGCESFSPASGWPYRQILDRLGSDFVAPKTAKGESVIQEAAKAIVEEYVNYYSDYWIAGLSVTQSALNVKKVEKLRGLVDELARVMERELLDECRQTDENLTARPGHFHDSLLLAHWEAQSYNGEQFVDLYDFCDCLEKRADSNAVVAQCGEVKKFLSSEFVLKSCYCGAAYQYSYGVSMYFPWSQVAPGYWNLDFIRESKGTGWGSFLRTYTLLTRRPPRGLSNGSELALALQATVDARAASVRMMNDRMMNDRMMNDRMMNDRMMNDRMMNDRMMNDRMMNDRMMNDRMSGASLRSRIHSMRNPPNVFFPDECLRDPQNTLSAQETLRL
jgi:hypothetical protein